MVNRWLASLGTAAAMVLAALLAPSLGLAGIFDHKRSAEAPRSYSMVEVARMIDSIEDKIRDDGTIVLKRPDVWGQARMSKYRLDFEHAIRPSQFPEQDGFAETLQAVIARTDNASFQSETAIAAALTPTPRGNNNRRAPITIEPGDVPGRVDALSNSISATIGLNPIADEAKNEKTPTLDEVSKSFTNLGRTGVQFQAVNRDTEGKPVSIGVALEPTIVLDEHKRYLDHLNEIRRVNMGDDTADSAGYGLYLFRMPASIQPGECTLKGHGAQLALTIRHEFTPDFTPETIKTLIINDLIDELAPIVYELIRGGQGNYRATLKKLDDLLRDPNYVKLKAELEIYEQQTTALKARIKKRVIEVLTTYLKEPKLNKKKIEDFVFDKKMEASSPKVRQAMQNLRDYLDSLDTAPLPMLAAADVETIADGKAQILLEEVLAKKVVPSGRAVMKIVPLDIAVTPPVLDSADPELVGIMAGLAATKQILQKLVEPPSGSGPSGPSDVKSPVNPKAGDNPVPGDGEDDRVPRDGVPPGTPSPPLASDFPDIVQVATQQQTKKDLAIFLAQTKAKELHTQLYRLVTSRPTTRLDDRAYPVPPSDLANVFGLENLLLLASDTSQAMLHKTIRATDVRSYLKRELNEAFAIMSGQGSDRGAMLGRADFIDDVLRLVEGRAFLEPKPEPALTEERPTVPGRSPEWDARYQTLQEAYRWMIWNLPFHKALPVNLNNPPDTLKNPIPPIDEWYIGNRDRGVGPLGPLCWAIAVDAGLLNRQLRKDIRRYQEHDGFECAGDLDAMHFYLPLPPPGLLVPEFVDADATFKSYVRTRWKMIAFALDPVTDQQNLGDSFSRTRDLQLSLAVAFAAGRINFQQFNRFRRQVQLEASTIALNRTVTAYVHGDDTFGWRFSPRYQTPPLERNNLQVAFNTIYRNGPRRNYQIDNSKLEAGQRELTAVVIMPSFLQKVRFDVEGSWFRLHDPDEVKPHTARKLEQGRKLIEVQQAVANVCDSGRYRRDDLDRLMVKVHQLEAMLPMQTQVVEVPYGNTLGGFELFSYGSGALAPELVGFQGVDVVHEGEEFEVFLYGKNISLQETKVIVGGKRLASDGKDTPGDVEIISREIVRVKVPREARPALLRGDDRQLYIEVFLATPNGISNRLLIPFEETPKPQAAAVRAVGPAAFTFADDAMVVNGTVQVVNGQAALVPRSVDLAEVRILAIAPPTNPSPITATFSFPVQKALNAVVVVPEIGFDPARRCYVIPQEKLMAMAEDLFGKLRDNGVLTSDGAFEKVLTSRSVAVEIESPAAVSSTTNQFSVRFPLFLLNPQAVPANPAPSARRAPSAGARPVPRVAAAPPRSAPASKPNQPAPPAAPAADPAIQRASHRAEMGPQPPRPAPTPPQRLPKPRRKTLWERFIASDR